MQSKDTIAVIGGARWGHVTISELTKMDLPFKQIVAVSKYNAESIQKLLDTLLPTTPYTLKWVATIDDLVNQYNPTAAIVVNAAPQHFDTAMKLIDFGVNMLIEKPVVLSTEHALALLDKAAQLGVCLVPGLNYRFLSYLSHFAEHVAKFPSQATSFTLDWADAKGDVRYFKDIFYADATTDLAQDLMSHVWAILATALQQTKMSVESCKVTGQGNIATFALKVQELTGNVILESNAAERRRIMTVNYADGQQLILDFTSEPGTITTGAAVISADTNWDNIPRSLIRQYKYFFDTMKGGSTTEVDAKALLDSVTLTANSSKLLQQCLENL